ncbi:MAG: hypothetical protein HY912_14735 [Desulfomonile tiedjei]|uniref:GAPS4 PD-(D/E)XK nuclease domain-containing protein n=1 Tax=Desulfomonile tiedjei TaxID=2358 RepID=A0A9D6V3B1_9BACT|nr:hypothetical protein [Desulfomonile tiedjei]
MSKELFSEFLWEQVGPWNWNWPCEEKERHNAKTHPSDIVFYYDEPYTLARSYINCDLKSYARGTISTGKVCAAIEGLARALTCAEKSDEWRNKYIHNDVSPGICGLLFVYNHDGEHDKDFSGLLDAVKHETLDIPKKSKIVVFGPKDIFWLNNVRYEIVQMRGTGELPAREHCRFFYPHLVRKKKVQLEHAKAATLEMLTGPWIILSYADPKSRNRRGVVIYYRRRGESVEEFLYLIDYLMHYQVLVDDTDVQIKTLDAHRDAPAFFGKAIDQYIDQCDGATDIKKLLDSIKYGQINQVQTRFSELDIGMENV